MPKHLTRFETVTTLPDATAYAEGFPLIHEGKLVLADPATPDWIPVEPTLPDGTAGQILTMGAGGAVSFTDPVAAPSGGGGSSLAGSTGVDTVALGEGALTSSEGVAIGEDAYASGEFLSTLPDPTFGQLMFASIPAGTWEWLLVVVDAEGREIELGTHTIISDGTSDGLGNAYAQYTGASGPSAPTFYGATTRLYRMRSPFSDTPRLIGEGQMESAFQAGDYDPISEEDHAEGTGTVQSPELYRGTEYFAASQSVAIGGGSYAGAEPGPAMSVAVGYWAVADLAESVVVGHFATGLALGQTVIGYYADTEVGADEAVAIGRYAFASSYRGTTVGASSYAYSADYATALGYAADSSYLYSTAIGANAVTDKDHQVKLGTEAEVVTLPGGLELATITLTTGMTLDIVDRQSIVLADATSAAMTLTLPAAETGRVIVVKKIDSSANAVTVATPGAETIDGAADHALAAQYDSVKLVSDGTNWFVI